MKLILFLIDDPHTGVEVPSSLPPKEPKVVINNILCKVLN